MWGHLCTELDNLCNFNVSFSTHKSEVLLHLSQWQYWWWFWFSFFWTFYFFVILRVVKHRVFKMGLRLNTSLRSRGKWGDYLVTLIPLSWCLNILLNSNFILRMIEWQAEAGCLTIRIHGKQWYWVYKYDLQNVYSTLSTPKNIGNKRWFVSHPEGSVLFDTYNQLTFAKLQDISQKEYFDEALIRDFNPTSSFTVFKDTPVQITEQLWVDRQQALAGFFRNRGNGVFTTAHLNPLLSRSTPESSLSFPTIFLQASEQNTATSEAAANLVPKLKKPNFKKPVISLSPELKARLRALSNFRKPVKLRASLKTRLQSLAAIYPKKRVSQKLVTRLHALAKLTPPRVVKIHQGLKTRLQALAQFPAKGYLRADLKIRLKGLVPHLAKNRINPALKARLSKLATFTNLGNTKGGHPKPVVNTPTPKSAYGIFQEALGHKQPKVKLVFSLRRRALGFVKSLKMRPNLIRRLHALTTIAPNRSTTRQKLFARFRALATFKLSYPNFVFKAKLRRVLFGAHNTVKPTNQTGLSIHNISWPRPFTAGTNVWQSVAGGASETPLYSTNYLQSLATSIVRSLTSLTFKRISLERPSTTLPAAQERFFPEPTFTVYPVSADLESEAFANSFFNDMLSVNNIAKTGANPTPTSFYENAVLDDDWEVYSNSRLQDAEAPVRILQHIPQKDNGMFSIKFLDSNESLVEKPDENIEFLVIKQKRYKRKQGFKLINAHPVAEDWTDGRTAPTSRFLKNNLIFTQIADIGAGSSYNYYSSIRLNRTRSEVFSVNLARRLLRTSRTLVLPAYTNLSIIANSYDVVHSWFIPGLGIKMDCVPGKSTHHSLYIDNVGLYYGQCAEICGRYHHHMPIRICALPFDHFIIWWTAKGLPKVLKMRYELKKLDETLLTKYVW